METNTKECGNKISDMGKELIGNTSEENLNESTQEIGLKMKDTAEELCSALMETDMMGSGSWESLKERVE